MSMIKCSRKNAKTGSLQSKHTLTRLGLRNGRDDPWGSSAWKVKKLSMMRKCHEGESVSIERRKRLLFSKRIYFFFFFLPSLALGRKDRITYCLTWTRPTRTRTKMSILMIMRECCCEVLVGCGGRSTWIIHNNNTTSLNFWGKDNHGIELQINIQSRLAQTVQCRSNWQFQGQFGSPIFRKHRGTVALPEEHNKGKLKTATSLQKKRKKKKWWRALELSEKNSVRAFFFT